MNPLIFIPIADSALKATPAIRDIMKNFGDAMADCKPITDTLFERIFLIAHHDCIPIILSEKTGFIRLSQWWSCWSVKWYSFDGRHQFALIDGVSKDSASKYFYDLKATIQPEKKKIK